MIVLLEILGVWLLLAVVTVAAWNAVKLTVRSRS